MSQKTSHHCISKRTFMCTFMLLFSCRIVSKAHEVTSGENVLWYKQPAKKWDQVTLCYYEGRSVQEPHS